MSVPLPRHAVFVIVQELSRARPPGKLPGQTCESFAARLTDDQRNVFFAHLDDAVRGAYALARKSGDGGRHAIATGALDDVALEHWAKQVAAGKVEAGRNIGPEMEADVEPVLLRQRHLGTQLVHAEPAQKVGAPARFAIDQEPVAQSGDEDVVQIFALGRQEGGVDSALRRHLGHVVGDDTLQEAGAIRPGEGDQGSIAGKNEHDGSFPAPRA